jgi:uncharacterized repeat protein (TIGR03803 family)
MLPQITVSKRATTFSRIRFSLSASRAKLFVSPWRRGKSVWLTAAWIVSLLLAGAPATAFAQFFGQLETFNGPNGATPTAPLTLGSDGDLYGTTTLGGAGSSMGNGNDGFGTIYKINGSGSANPFAYTLLYSFMNGTDGAGPYGALVQGTDGNFYGTTTGQSAEGQNGQGTFFVMTPQGSLTTLYSFTGGSDGGAPMGGLILATDGNFYGTTSAGGDHAAGTVFQITPQGSLTPIYEFCPSAFCVDGQNPYAGLVQGTDGNFYGTTPIS